MIPGEITGPDDVLVINEGRERLTVIVDNTGDRPVQIGSHFHFAETNPALAFDRTAAHGFRLDIPAGTAIRFEPGISIEVDLVAIGGNRIVPGLRGAVGGPLDTPPSTHGSDTDG
jgi:urease beta subunit